MATESVELLPNPPRISRQAALILGMLLLMPTAAAITGMTWVVQQTMRWAGPRATVVIAFVVGLLLIDLAVVVVFVAWRARRRAKLASNTIGPRGIELSNGRHGTFLGWEEFSEVTVDPNNVVVGWLPEDVLAGAHPLLSRLPRGRLEQGVAPVRFGQLPDPETTRELLRHWAGQRARIG